jgi:hypothetical protein
MKITTTKFYTVIFIIVIFLQLYLPSFRANVFVQIAALGLFFLFEKMTFSNNFLKTVLPVILLIFVGLLGIQTQKYLAIDIIKDIFHFVKPLLGIFIGYFFYKKINNFKQFIKTIVLIGFVSAIIHFCIILFFSKIGTVSNIREFGKDNFLELFALFFLGYYKKFQKESLFLRKTNYNIILYSLLASNTLYFSRTMIVVAILLWLSIQGYTKITKTSVKIVVMLTALVLCFYVYLFSVKIDRDKPGISSFLYKIKIAPSEILRTKVDRENHKDLWDHWRGYEAKRAFVLMQNNPSTFIYGCGYGSLVNLRFWAPLSNDSKGMKYISELHNGYAFVFYKTGIIGICIYLTFLYLLYNRLYDFQDFGTVFISAIGLVFLFTTVTITGIYNTKDVIVFILGAMLFYQKKTNLKLIETSL